MYIAIRTDDGRNIGKISFYCNTLQVSRQAFYDYLGRKGKPWKYQPLADAMLKIHDEDEENADYGRVRMYQALKYRKEVGKLDGIKIPCEATVRSVMEQINLIHKPKRKPNGITKADREARKSDDLLKRDFTADAPLQKCVTDITEIPAKDGKLYVSAIFDCYDLLPVGLAIKVVPENCRCGLKVPHHLEPLRGLMHVPRFQRQVLHFPLPLNSVPDYRTETQNQHLYADKQSVHCDCIGRCPCHQ